MIAEILFEAAWKSMIVAGGLVALLILMARQTPANRVSVGGLGFALLMLLPAAVWGLAFYPLPLFEVAAPVAPAIDPALLLGTTAMPAATDAGAAPSGYSYQELAVAAWLTGAAALVFRLGSGLLTLRHWAKRAELAEFPSLNRIMVAGGVPRSTRLLVSEDINAPLSFGWRRPRIMIDRTTLADLAQAEAAIAHEVAHLSRGDWPRLIVARLVVSIFWFNPFVWLLERLYLQDVEEAADAEATRMVEPAVYAQALLNVARGSFVPVGANSIASGTLSRRIRKVLTGRSGSRWDRTWRIGALAGVAAVAGPIALLQFAAPAVSAVAEPVLAPVAAIVSPTPAAPAAAPSPAALVPIAPLAATPPTAPVARVAPTAPVARVAQATPVALAIASVAPEAAPIDRAEIERIKRSAEVMRVQSEVIARDSKKIAERARAQVAVAMANARQDMLRGADEMERGAVEMRRGAAQMRDEARKLRDPAYRAKVIAEARENQGRWRDTNWKNKVPTDQELIDAIPKLEQGADKMDAGVEKMREGAAQMRRSAQGN